MAKHVCAILPIANRNYIKLAKKTVDLFLKQHYLPVELLIVNSTQTPILTEDTDYLIEAGIHLREITFDYGSGYDNHASLYNVGILNTEAEWIVPLNPTIYSHPSRLVYQLAQADNNCPCVLSYQVAVDVTAALEATEPVRPEVKLLHNPFGIASTLIFPRVMNNELVTYNETLNYNEQEDLLDRCRQRNSIPVVCDNRNTALVDGMNWPMLSVAFYCGFNATDKSNFFCQSIGLEGKLSPADYSLLSRIFTIYSFQVTNGLV